MGKREFETKDNFFSVELKEGEVVAIVVTNPSNTTDDNMQANLAFTVPYDCKLAGYVKKDIQPLQYHKGKLF